LCCCAPVRLRERAEKAQGRCLLLVSETSWNAQLAMIRYNKKRYREYLIQVEPSIVLVNMKIEFIVASFVPLASSPCGRGQRQ
jgi:hypothetical protein